MTLSTKTSGRDRLDITNRVLLDLFEQDTYYALNARQAAMLRAAGELTILPAALTTYAGASVTAGEFTQAAHLLEQSDAISAATSAPPHRSVRTYLAACLGQEQQAEQLAQATIQEATERGEGSEVTIALFALTFLRNGLAHYEQAFTACTAALAYDDVGMHGHLLNEMVEAAARSARRDIAESAAGELIERAAASPTRTALGYAARAKAILDSEPSAETEYLTAITELDKTPLDVLAARTHLIFGEWLRRANRRAEASSRLRTAYEMFRQMGADGVKLLHALVEKNDALVKTMYPNYAQTGENDMFATELRIVVPDAQSTVTEGILEKSTKLMKLSEFKKWLEEGKLVSS